MQKKAAKALLSLSMEDGQVRTYLLEHKAIPALLKLSEAGSAQARKRCAMALCNLLCTPDGEASIIELNAVGAFDALAQCDDEEIREKYVQGGSPTCGQRFVVRCSCNVRFVCRVVWSSCVGHVVCL